MRERRFFFEKRQLFLKTRESSEFLRAQGRRAFGGGRQRRHFRGCCTGGKKCVNLQVIVPGSFGARKMTQENILGHIRTRQNAQ